MTTWQWTQTGAVKPAGLSFQCALREWVVCQTCEGRSKPISEHADIAPLFSSYELHFPLWEKCLHEKLCNWGVYLTVQLKMILSSLVICLQLSQEY